MSNILILRSGAIGDIILTFPLVLACIERFGRENVTCAAPGLMKPVARLAGIDSYIDIDICGLHRLYTSDFQPNDASPLFNKQDCILNCLSGDNSVLHTNLNTCAREVYSLAPPDDRITTHAAVYLASVLPGIGTLPEARIIPERFGPVPDKILSLFSSGKPVLTLHPGTGSPRKLIPHGLFENLIARETESKTVIILTGPADGSLIPFVRNMADAYTCKHLDSLPLEQVAYILHRSSWYVGLDSGISHIAGMTGTPSHVIFSATDPELWRPRSSAVTVISPEEIENTIDF